MMTGTSVSYSDFGIAVAPMMDGAYNQLKSITYQNLRAVCVQVFLTS